MPLDTVLLLDTSGSMAGRGIRELKRACTTFLDGVEETARQTGLKENVGIVEFNQTAKVLQSLTNNYVQCRRAIENLKAGGQTAMFDGLMTALKEIIENGGVLRVAGIPMTPRIILMTDGRPTDPKVDEDDEGRMKLELVPLRSAREKVLKAALSFGPAWRLVGLPFPVPIACVGCGDCDPSLLDAIADITKGMFVIVENIDELSTFFRRQVLLIRFAAKFASDMQRLRSQLALAAFLRDLGEAVEEAEVAGMQRLLLAMLHMSDDDDDSDEGAASRRPGSSGGSGGGGGPTTRAITSGPSQPGATSFNSRSRSPVPPSASGSSAMVRAPLPPGTGQPTAGAGSTRIIVQQRRVLVASARPPGAPPPGPPGLYMRPPPGQRGPNGEDEECVIQ